MDPALTSFTFSALDKTRQRYEPQGAVVSRVLGKIQNRETCSLG